MNAIIWRQNMRTVYPGWYINSWAPKEQRQETVACGRHACRLTSSKLMTHGHLIGFDVLCFSVVLPLWTWVSAGFPCVHNEIRFWKFLFVVVLLSSEVRENVFGMLSSLFWCLQFFESAVRIVGFFKVKLFIQHLLKVIHTYQQQIKSMKEKVSLIWNGVPL